MPHADFGETLSFNSSLWVQLKAKGDSVHFRLIGKPFYDGVHLFKSSGGWLREDCPRINSGSKCSKCEIFFEKKALEKAETDPIKKKSLEEDARVYQAKITFYYPILNRRDHKFQVLKTTMGVRTKIENDAAAGVKIMERDFVLTRTENAGSDYYSLTRLDSADTLPISDVEREQIEKGKSTNIESLVTGSQPDDGTAVAEQADTIHIEKPRVDGVVPEPDFPF